MVLAVNYNCKLQTCKRISNFLFLISDFEAESHKYKPINLYLLLI